MQKKKKRFDVKNILERVRVEGGIQRGRTRLERCQESGIQKLMVEVRVKVSEVEAVSQKWGAQEIRHRFGDQLWTCYQTLEDIPDVDKEIHPGT